MDFVCWIFYNKLFSESRIGAKYFQNFNFTDTIDLYGEFTPKVISSTLASKLSLILVFWLLLGFLLFKRVNSMEESLSAGLKKSRGKKFIRVPISKIFSQAIPYYIIFVSEARIR